MAGAPAVIPSTTVRENDSKGDGATSACAPRSKPHLDASSIRPVTTMSGPSSGGSTTCPTRTSRNAPGVALLVGAEVAPEDPRALLVVHPPDAQQVGRVPQPEECSGALGRSVDLLDPQADHHLRRGGHAEALDHQPSLAACVEGEAAALGEHGVEDGQVEGRLLVGSRMEDGPLPHAGQAADRRVVEVGVEGHHVGIAGLDRIEEGRGLGALQVDPALGVLLAGTLGIGQEHLRQGVERLAPSRLRGDAVHRDPVDAPRCPSGSSSRHVRASSDAEVKTSTWSPRSATRCSASMRAPVSAPPRISRP